MAQKKFKETDEVLKTIQENHLHSDEMKKDLLEQNVLFHPHAGEEDEEDERLEEEEDESDDDEDEESEETSARPNFYIKRADDLARIAKNNFGLTNRPGTEATQIADLFQSSAMQVLNMQMRFANDMMDIWMNMFVPRRAHR
jgi:hypothetical protein